MTKFENAASFLVCPTIHTNPSGKWSFSKMLSKVEEFENIAF